MKMYAIKTKRGSIRGIFHAKWKADEIMADHYRDSDRVEPIIIEEKGDCYEVYKIIKNSQ